MDATQTKQTIMVVDDVPLNIQIISELLGDSYEICFATSGAESLEILNKVLPDLILLDVMMPDISGYELCKQLKADPLLREIPIIFITALSKQDDEIIGLRLGAVDYITKPFNPEIVRLRVKNQLELKRYRDLYARLSLQDGLTGIPNRRAFDDQLKREWLRALRTQTLISLVMIDIDHFKDYNDYYGHLGGDDCLKQIAAALLTSLRASDFAARYGGEEFVCVLSETDPAGALITSERIRTTIESLRLAHASSPVSPYVTVSLGVATLKPGNEFEPGYLIDLADQLLYQAKNSGRNNVMQQQ